MGDGIKPESGGGTGPDALGTRDAVHLMSNHSKLINFKLIKITVYFNLKGYRNKAENKLQERLQTRVI